MIDSDHHQISDFHMGVGTKYSPALPLVPILVLQNKIAPKNSFEWLLKVEENEHIVLHGLPFKMY